MSDIAFEGCVKPLDETPNGLAAFQPMRLARNEWRGASSQALAWPLNALLDDPLAINPWLATAMRIVSFSILVFMAFVASAP